VAAPRLTQSEGEEAEHGEESVSISDAWKVLIKCKTICEDNLVPSMAVLTRGEMGPAFVETVSAHECDFAVVGSRCLGALKRYIRNSVSSFAVQRLLCPCVVVRWGLAPTMPEKENRRYSHRAALSSTAPPLSQNPGGDRAALSATASLVAVAKQDRLRRLSQTVDDSVCRSPRVSDATFEDLPREGTKPLSRSSSLERKHPRGGSPAKRASSDGEQEDQPKKALSSKVEGASPKGDRTDSPLHRRLEGGASPLPRMAQGSPLRGMGSPAVWHERRQTSPTMSPLGGPTMRGRCVCVGVDGSSGAKAALKWAFANYYTEGDVILLVHCIPLQFNPGAGYGAGMTYKALEEKAKVQGIKVLKKSQRYCARSRIRATPLLARGDPGTELAQVAEKHQCDLAVVGAHGESLDARLRQSTGMLSSVKSALSFGRNRDMNRFDNAGPLFSLGTVCMRATFKIHVPIVVVKDLIA